MASKIARYFFGKKRVARLENLFASEIAVMLRDPPKKVAPESSARECGGPTIALLEDNFYFA